MDTNIDENFNLCELSDYISNIKGLSSNSSSPSDTWIVKFKDDITYKNKPVNYGFLKIFIDTSNLNFTSKTTLEATLGLLYELNLYKTIINNLVRYNICPNFLQCLAIGDKCSFEDLLKILKGNLFDMSYSRVLNDHECKNNLNRNMNYMIRKKEKRPAIQSNESLDIVSSKPIDYSTRPFKFNMMLLENMEDNITFHRWLSTYNRRDYDVEFLNVLFQISVACYAMSLSKMVHNDLHDNNIFIKDLGVEKYFLYNIDDKKIVIKTRYIPLIYDFDRGYQEKLGNNPSIIGRTLCSHYSQCNVFVENKDIIKSLCYVYKRVNKDYVKNDIINIVSKNSLGKLLLKDTYNLISPADGLKRCFLQYVDDIDSQEKAMPVKWYENFNDTLSIVKNISSKLPPYSVKNIDDDDNIFNCNRNLFDEDGTLDILKAIETKINSSEYFYSHIRHIDEPLIFNRINPADDDDLNLSEFENLSLTNSQLVELNELLPGSLIKDLDAGRRKKKRRKSSVNKKYCVSTPQKKMGFSQKASCKAQGYIKRTSKKYKGKYMVSPKYKKSKSKGKSNSRKRKKSKIKSRR
jgi:hypothetical protein